MVLICRRLPQHISLSFYLFGQFRQKFSMGDSYRHLTVSITENNTLLQRAYTIKWRCVRDGSSGRSYLFVCDLTFCVSDTPSNTFYLNSQTRVESATVDVKRLDIALRKAKKKLKGIQVEEEKTRVECQRTETNLVHIILYLGEINWKRSTPFVYSDETNPHYVCAAGQLREGASRGACWTPRGKGKVNDGKNYQIRYQGYEGVCNLSSIHDVAFDDCWLIQWVIVHINSVQCPLYKRWCDLAMEKITKGKTKMHKFAKKVYVIFQDIGKPLNTILLIPKNHTCSDLGVRAEFDIRSLLLPKVSIVVYFVIGFESVFIYMYGLHHKINFRWPTWDMYWMTWHLVNRIRASTGVIRKISPTQSKTSK